MNLVVEYFAGNVEMQKEKIFHCFEKRRSDAVLKILCLVEVISPQPELDQGEVFLIF